MLSPNKQIATSLVLALATANVAVAEPVDWVYRLNSQHTADFTDYAKISAPYDPNKPVKWNRVCTPATSSPGIAFNRAFLCESGQVNAVSLNDGKAVWQYVASGKTKSPKFTSSPAVSHDLVCFGDENGTFYAIDAAKGILKWKFKAQGSINSSPVISDAQVLFTSQDGYLYNLNLSNGKLNWRVALRPAKNVCPAVDAGVVYVPSENNTLSAINLISGVLKWKAKLDGNAEVPSVNEGRVFASAGQSICAFDAKTGGALWKYTSQKNVSAEVAITWHRLVFTTGDTMGVLDCKTGKLVAACRLGDFLTSPSIANQLAFCGSSNGVLYAVELHNGRTRWSVKTGHEIRLPPVLDRGTLLLTSNMIYAIDINVMDWLTNHYKKAYALDLQSNPTKKRFEL